MDATTTKSVYTNDVIANGGYLYTGKQIYSACVATRKQSEEIHAAIKRFCKPPFRFLDIGCGDGTYTVELARKFPGANISGFDMTDEAIKKARSLGKKTSIHFTTADAYTMSKRYRKQSVSLGIFRGVLHHMDYPWRAIKEVSKITDSVLILEPNGYNPILKLIEKISPYHKAHGEKSFLPLDIDCWFEANGYTPVYRKFFSIVPYFCPDWLTDILKKLEPVLETIPFVNRLYCGGYLALYKKS